MTVRRDDARDRREPSPVDIAALLRATRQAESDGSEARDRARALLELQDAFTAIARAKRPTDIIDLTLGAVRAPLGFTRAVWLARESADLVVARRRVDRYGHVDVLEEILTSDRSNRSAMFADHSTAIETGEEGELGAPLVDARGWYALAPILQGDRTSCFVYADGHSTERVRPWIVERLGALTAITSIALENVALLERLQTLASRDPLTGLYNRRAFEERLSAHLARAARGTPLVLAIIDVDNFKAVNDVEGHAVGDAVLKRLARTLLASSRTEDVVARFAGDEFIVILDDVVESAADAMVARLSANLAAAHISCSIGAARSPRDGIDADVLFKAADRALYFAKASGKNCHVLAR